MSEAPVAPVAPLASVPLAGFDIDVVRLALERDIVRRLYRELGVELSRSLPSSELVRREWLADSVKLSLALAPRALALVENARRMLAVEREVELYTSEKHRACIALTGSGALHIRVHDLFLADPDDGALLAVIDAPIYVRVGALDVATPPSLAEAIVSRARRGRLDIVAGCAHALLYEDRDATVAAMVLALVGER